MITSCVLYCLFLAKNVANIRVHSSSLTTHPSVFIPPLSSQCDASEATWQLIQVVLGDDDNDDTQHRIVFLGGGCSPATEPLAALSGRFYNVTQVIIIRTLLKYIYCSACIHVEYTCI